MALYSMSQISEILQGRHQGPDTTFQAISTDSRSIKSGELFIALVGPNFDGHQFIEEAAARGAIGAIVSKPVATTLPTVTVADTRLALGQLAAWHRQQVNIPIIAVTGSCGKTTTKSMLASILAECGKVLATQGTLNNDFGVPLTLMQLTDAHQFAVIELGANHFQEISYITHITRPTVAIITNAAPAHLEGFGDLAGVARAKGEIFEGLTADGIAILNADDEFADYWRGLIGQHRFITFGMDHAANVFASEIQTGDDNTRFKLHTPQGVIDVTLPLLGQHNVSNALAAAAATQAVGASLTAIKAGLENLQPVAKRLVKQVGHNGAQIIDDSYNANPVAFTAALQVLAQTQGDKILVMGDMGELGSMAEQYHIELGQKARQLGIQQVYAVGNLSRLAVKEFGQTGYHFETLEELIAAVKGKLTPSTTVLIKGSRSARMERVVSALVGTV